MAETKLAASSMYTYVHKIKIVCQGKGVEISETLGIKHWQALGC